MKLICLLAGADWAVHYDERHLSPQDQMRVRQNPNLNKNLDWKTSRTLKQYAPLPVISLSHSHGVSALLCGEHGFQAGIDIEQMQVRDYAKLAQWILSDAEKQDFPNLNCEQFYQVWTLKEALLKAANLSFPADMPHVGLKNAQTLHVLGQTDWHGMNVRIHSFMLTIAWFGHTDLEMDVQILGDGKIADKIKVIQRW